MEEQKLSCIEQVWLEPGWSHVRFRTQFDRRRNDPNCHVVLTNAQLSKKKIQLLQKHVKSHYFILQTENNTLNFHKVITY